MIQARVLTLTTRFAYNGDGARRTVEVVGYGATTYTLDYARGNRVLAEETLTGTLLYLYGYDCLGQFDDAEDEWLYYLNDASGYVRQGADAQGQVVSSWLFDPDGTVLEGPNGLVSHLICGGVYDWSTGLIHRDGRYFDPMLGIWLALAPLVVVQSWKGRKRKRRGMPWYVLVLVVVGVGSGMLTACDDGDPPTKPPDPGPGEHFCYLPYIGGGGPPPPPEQEEPQSPLPEPPPEPTPTPSEIARITSEEILAAGGTIEAYLKSEEDTVLLTRLAMAESRQSLEDRIYVMWIVRLRTEIAYSVNVPQPGQKTSVQQEIFAPDQFAVIPDILNVADPRAVALEDNVSLACGGSINGAIYPCDVSGHPENPPNPDDSNAQALIDWKLTYNEAQTILAFTSEQFLSEFPPDLRGYDGFRGYNTGYGVRIVKNVGNFYYDETDRDEEWLWWPTPTP